METSKTNLGKRFFVAIMPWCGITTPNSVIVSETIAKSSVFNSVEIRKILFNINHHEQKLCHPNDLPNISEIENEKLCQTLDEDGVIRIGQTINYNDVLIAKISNKDAMLLDANEKLQASIFGQVVTNESEKMPFRDTAVVVDTEKRENSVVVYVAIKRSLCVGDVLLDKKGNEIVVVDIIKEDKFPKLKNHDAKIEMIVTPGSLIEESFKSYFSKTEEGGWNDLTITYSLENPGFALVTPKKKWRKSKKWENRNEVAMVGNLSLIKKEQLSEQKICSFGISEISKINQQVLGGLKINQNFLVLLKNKGLIENLREFMSVKSDDKKSHMVALKAIIRGTDFPTEMNPFSFEKLKVILQALCFDIKTESNEIKILPIDTTNFDYSFGEISNPDPFNYKKNIYEDGGILDQKIFGPVKDYVCECGRYKGIEYNGVICPSCGVKLLSKDERFERFGHIKLELPMINPFFQNECDKFTKEFYHFVNIEEEYEKLEKAVGEFSMSDYVANYIKENLKVPYLLQYLPVIPAGHRPFFRHSDGVFHTSDLNDLYRRVIIRNNRLKRLMEIKAPNVILVNEAIMLQEGINSLFFGKNEMKGLVQHFSETNELLFNKKVSYVAKGVVVPDLSLAVDECSIPRKIALNLFEPLIFRELMKKRKETFKNYLDSAEEIGIDPIASTFKKASEYVKKQDQIAIDFLPEVSKDSFVLISSGKQTEVFGFKSVISEDEVIRLHPDAIDCLGINLSSNRYVNVYLPLSIKAQKEASDILFSSEETCIRQPVSLNSAFQLNMKDLCEITQGNKSGNIPFTEFDSVLFNKI